MGSNNTFGIHFITRQNQKGNYTIIARIVVNKIRCELGSKQTIEKTTGIPAKAPTGVAIAPASEYRFATSVFSAGPDGASKDYG
jgi:hypothetical protein